MYLKFIDKTLCVESLECFNEWEKENYYTRATSYKCLNVKLEDVKEGGKKKSFGSFATLNRWDGNSKL